MPAAGWAAQARSIAARWEHGHDGLTPDCALCNGEYAEVQALTEHHRIASYASTTDFLEQPVTHPNLNQTPGHPLVLATINGERDITWSCPPACPTPGSCATINVLRSGTGWYGPGWSDGQYLATSGPFGLIFTHADGSTVNNPIVTSAATEYELTLLPTEHPVYRYYAVTVRSTPDGWGIFREDLCLRTDGTAWDDNTITSGTAAEFLAAHRFPRMHEALEAAEKAAPNVTVYGVTAQQMWTKSDNERRVSEIFGSARPAGWRPRHDETTLDILAALAPQMDPRAAATWMTTPRYPSTTGDRTALQEIAAGNGHLILDQARTTATQNGAQ